MALLRLQVRSLFLAMIVALLPAPKVSAETIPPFELNELTRDKCLAILRRALKSDEFWPAMHAAEALTISGNGEEVRTALAPQLEVDNDLRHRCGLARELVRAGDRSQASVLLEVLAVSDSTGHIHACESLYKVDEAGDGTLLRQAMADSSSPVKSLMAAAALARQGDAAAFASLRKTLEVSDPQVARLAAWVLGVIGNPQDIPALNKGLSKMSQPRDAAYFEHALALLGDSAGKQALLRNLQSSDAGIRADAACFAGEAGLIQAQGQLVKLLDDQNLDVTVRAAQSLLTLALANDTPVPLTPMVTTARKVGPSPAAPAVVLELPPGPENSRNSEGSFIQTTDGRLLFIYSYFGKGTGDDYDAAELRERVSTDSGKTWLPEERTVVKPASGLNVMSVSLLRLQSGEIALFYCSKVSHSDCRPEMRISKDEGKTWGEPVQCITDHVDYYVLNNDRAVRLKSGRIVLPVCLHKTLSAKKNDWQGECMCYLSDDNGRTWRRSKSAFTAKDAAGKRLTIQEPGVVELKDGRAMMFIRSNSGSQMLSYSEDGCDTWSEPKTSNMISPVSPASIKRIPQTGDLLLVWNNHEKIDPALKGKRTPLDVAISRDEGQTWEQVKTLYNDPNGWYCYIAIDFVDDEVLLGHCAGDRRKNGLAKCDVTRFNLAWLYGDGK